MTALPDRPATTTTTATRIARAHGRKTATWASSRHTAYARPLDSSAASIAQDRSAPSPASKSSGNQAVEGSSAGNDALVKRAHCCIATLVVAVAEQKQG